MWVTGHFGLKKMHLKIDETYTFYCLLVAEVINQCKFQQITSIFKNNFFEPKIFHYPISYTNH